MIRHNAVLKARIARLEQRKKPCSFPRFVFHVSDRPDAEIIGYQSGKLTVLRNGPVEPLGELQARAWELGASISLAALYAPENRPVADVAEPSAALPVAEPWVEPIPGVGRRAGRAELIKAGAIRVPPERLI